MKLAEIVSAGMPALIQQYGSKLTANQRQALNAIINCRTGSLGSTLMRCLDCGHGQLRHRSCGNRSCPQCQHHTSAAWLARQQAKLLPTNYFMVTFTLPAQLRPLAYANPKPVYRALFDVAIDTLNTFAQNEPQLSGRLGACAVLHTHSRRLDYHPHVHLIVPGAAIDPKRKQWRKLKRDYLFNGMHLARVFRPRMIEAIKALQLTVPDNPESWNVQCKFVGKGLPAIKYLSRYLYRGVINERDLIAFDRENNTVTFRYRDNKTGELRFRTLTLVDFLWRIAMQVLPKGFRRARDYGYLHGNAKTRLVLLQLLLCIQLKPPTVKVAMPHYCAECHGSLRIVGFLKPG